MFKKLTMAAAILYAGASMFSVCEAKAHKTIHFEQCAYQKTIETARETLWKEITNGSGTGATIAVMDNNKIVYAEGVGTSDRAKNRPVDVNTRFNIGSTSKMFAAAAVMLLADDGKIALDDKVIKYIPDFKMKDERYKDITIRMLFNHSSGLPGSTFYFGFGTAVDMHKLLLDTLAESHLKHDPGAMAIYCNDGFTLAEIIVERVSGQKFVDFVTEHIFKPLNMKNSGPSVGEGQFKNSAEYYDIKSGDKYPLEVVPVYGAGGLSSTASDLCKFGSSFTKNGKKILSEESLKEILKTQPTLFANKLQNRQICSEFGWDFSNIPFYDAKGIQVLAKSGGTGCYSTYMYVVPEHNIVIAYSITGHASSEKLLRPVLDTFMQEKKLIAPVTKPVVKPAEPQEIPEGLLKYAGIYTNGEKTIRIEFDLKGKKMNFMPLTVEGATKKTESPAPATSMIYNNGYFISPEDKMQLYFTAADGKTYLAAHNIPNYEADLLTYQKVEEIKKPITLKSDINGKIWLSKNVPADVLPSGISVVKSETYKELPGYVDFAGLKKIESPEFAGIAATSFRDQSELRLIEKDGKTWASSNYILYAPSEKARTAITGVNRLVIKHDNYNEWLKITKGAVLNFVEIPKDARAIVLTENGAIFDSVTNKGEIYAPEGSFVFCAGTYGDIFKIIAR